MLGDAVSDVRASERLTESAVCIVAPESGMDRQLEKLLASAGRGVAASKPVLEINPAHELIRKLAELGETEIALREDAAHLLLDEALVADGERPRDAKAFAARLGRVIGRAAGANVSVVPAKRSASRDPYAVSPARRRAQQASESWRVWVPALRGRRRLTIRGHPLLE